MAPNRDDCPTNWLPEGKVAAVCFSVDDVHPSTSNDYYESGGDLANGSLGFVERLLERHSELKATLFVTPDWRPIQLISCRYLASLPILRNYVYHVDLHPVGHFRVDRFPTFIRYLNGLIRTDVALHGLHHVHRGPDLAVEFQEQSYPQCVNILRKGLQIFTSAGLHYVNGFAPPGWNLPDTLSLALNDLEFSFVVSARDIHTQINPSARNAMSGIRNVSLLQPQYIYDTMLISIPTNFQATSPITRADEIIACNGLLSIKAHAFKHGGGHTMKDGLDKHYFEFLDGLFSYLEQRYGDALWWASMNEIATHFRVT